jgi:hypothetical protein
MTTIGDKLRANHGLGSGFDLLRVALAMSVVAWHSDTIVTGDVTPVSHPAITRVLG